MRDCIRVIVFKYFDEMIRIGIRTYSETGICGRKAKLMAQTIVFAYVNVPSS